VSGMEHALLLVDLQNDFMPFGSLPVAEGDAVVHVANTLMPHYDLVVATQDWHPASHGSFASNHPGKRPGDHVQLGGVDQVLWPDHCVQDSPGASFHSGLDVGPIAHVVHKGTDPGIDSYSTFFDNHHLRSTGLESYLCDRGVARLTLVGLATDYCVLYSVRDAVELGFRVTVVEDGVRGVNLAPGDDQRALVEMRERGARVLRSEDLRREL